MTKTAKAICKGARYGEIIAFPITGRNDPHLDFERIGLLDVRLYSLGGADIIMRAEGKAHAVCQGSQSRVIYSVTFSYFIDDWFIDAFDPANLFAGNLDLIGTPFPFLVTWSITRRSQQGL